MICDNFLILCHKKRRDRPEKHAYLENALFSARILPSWNYWPYKVPWRTSPYHTSFQRSHFFFIWTNHNCKMHYLKKTFITLILFGEVLCNSQIFSCRRRRRLYINGFRFRILHVNQYCIDMKVRTRHHFCFYLHMCFFENLDTNEECPVQKHTSICYWPLRKVTYFLDMANNLCCETTYTTVFHCIFTCFFPLFLARKTIDQIEAHMLLLASQKRQL